MNSSTPTVQSAGQGWSVGVPRFESNSFEGSPPESLGSAVPTLVVSQGEVGVVGGLWSQAVVEVLSTRRLIWIHRRHRLDQLDFIKQTRELDPSGGTVLIHLFCCDSKC